MNPFESFDTDLVVTFTAVFVAGLAAVLGIWMERDPKKPPRYAWALSALILLATFVSLMQSLIDKREQDVIKDDMARLLTTMERLATESDDPALLELVKAELTAQSRSDPSMVERVAQRVSDEGRDPGEVLGKHLDAAEVEKVTRKGSIKAKATDKVATTEPVAPKRGRIGRGDDDKDKADADDKADTKETAAAPARPVPPMSEEAAKAAAAAAAARLQQGRPGVPPGAVAPPVPPPTEAVAAPAPTPTPTPRAGAPKPGEPRGPGAGKRPTPKRPKAR